jgi:hypothetical protein
VVEVSVEVSASASASVSHPGLDVEGSSRNIGVRTSGLDRPGLDDMSIGSSCDAMSYGIELMMNMTRKDGSHPSYLYEVSMLVQV